MFNFMFHFHPVLLEIQKSLKSCNGLRPTEGTLPPITLSPFLLTLNGTAIKALHFPELHMQVSISHALFKALRVVFFKMHNMYKTRRNECSVTKGQSRHITYNISLVKTSKHYQYCPMCIFPPGVQQQSNGKGCRKSDKNQ